MKRREFISSAALATGGLAAIESQSRSPEPAGTGRAAGRRFDLGTVTYNLGRTWNLETLIQNCERLGYGAVELRSTHGHGVEPDISPARRREIRERFESTPVRLFGLGSACEFHSPDAAEVRRNIELTRGFLRLAADVGATGVKVRPNGLPESVRAADTIRQIGVALSEVGETARELGVEVWVEAHGRGTQEPSNMREIMDRCGHASVGVTWNSNAADVQNGSVADSFGLLAQHIRCVHLHELTGDYPYRELFGLLREIGYDRWTMSEVAGSEEPDRFMGYYRALWNELSRA